jgi:hypothetical protein
MRADMWDEDLIKIQNIIDEKCYNDLIMIGDFNARVGKQNVYNCSLRDVSESRISQDTHKNTLGRKLIAFCEDMSLTMLNGRFKGDEEGRLTFHGARGRSVIDYCLCKSSVFEFLDSFQVLDALHSDHSPVMLDMLLKSSENSQASCKLLPVVKYYPNKKDLYNSKIDQVVESWQRNNIEPSSENIVSILQEIGGVFSKSVCYTKKEKWFDWECEVARLDSFKKLKLIRKNYKSDILQILYLEANKKYRTICKKKKCLY